MDKPTKDAEPDLRSYIRSADAVADELGSRWTDDAACAQPGIDPDLWMPGEKANTKESRANNRKAVGICFNECPIRLDCLKAACIAREGYGIWGGLNRTTRKGSASTGRKPHDYDALAILPNPYE